MQLEFWIRFYNKLSVTKKIGSLQTPRGQYWYDIAVGKSNIHISNTFNTDQYAVGLRIYIRHQIADTMFPFLEEYQSEIHAGAGSEMNWNPNPNARDKAITLTRTFDPDNEKSQEEVLDWLVNLTITMRERLIKLLKGFS